MFAAINVLPLQLAIRLCCDLAPDIPLSPSVRATRAAPVVARKNSLDNIPVPAMQFIEHKRTHIRHNPGADVHLVTLAAQRDLQRDPTRSKN